MSVRVSLKQGPVTKPLRFPYADVTITARRLRSPEWDSARDAAQAILRNDAELLNLLVKHELLPEGGVRGWKRMKDTDPVAYAAYQQAAQGVFDAHGGRFLARGGHAETIEGEADERHVIVEFPSFAAAHACYASAQYVAARRLPAGAARVRIVFVEGA